MHLESLSILRPNITASLDCDRVRKGAEDNRLALVILVLALPLE